MVDNYKRLFGESPLHRSQSPLESNDHPEIDSSEFFGEDDRRRHSEVSVFDWCYAMGHQHWAF
jgi:hypothetical protein